MSARLLAIESEAGSFDQVGDDLEQAGFDVIVAHGLTDARARLDELVVDAVLIDVPYGGDFPELVRQIRADQRAPGLPVVAVCRNRVGFDPDFGAGSDDLVDADMPPVHMARRIRHLIDSRQALQDAEAKRVELEQRLNARQGVLAAQVRECEALRERIASERNAVPSVLVLEQDGAVLDFDAGTVALFDGFRPIPGRRLAELSVPIARVVDAFVRSNRTEAREHWPGGGSRQIELRRRELADGRLAVLLRDVTELGRIDAWLAGRRAASNPEPVATDGYHIARMIGTAPGLREVARLVDRLRHVRATVLIVGETGTGKELVARALHFDGRFRERAFIPIHCGAISPELIESELFGYEKGAFTGALQRKDGLFAAADGGTVFLDEIAETSHALQVKLLRVLQLGEIRPVGATRPRHVDVRIIAATNRNLREMLVDEQFREDLYYRLESVTLHLPPLRERMEDLPELVAHFLEVWNRKLETRTPVRDVSRGALDLMATYPWPGNVRELENVIKGAVAIGVGDRLHEEHLPARVREGREAPPSGRGFEPSTRGGEPFRVDPFGAEELQERKDQVDRVALIRAMQRFRGDKQAAAAHLGMSRSTFYRKLKQLGVS